MARRLVAPLGFLIGLTALFFVIQTLGGSSPKTTMTANGPEAIQQFALTEIPPIAATVTTKDDQKIDLATLLTRPTLITFWSVGCGECTIGLPVQETFAHGQSLIKIILINVKDDPKDAQEKLQSLKVTLDSYYDRDGLASQAWQATMPSSYFVKDGKIKYFFPGRVGNDHLQALLTVQ